MRLIRKPSDMQAESRRWQRQGRRDEALTLLERAYTLLPGTPRYGYVYAVALHDAGSVGKAIAVLTSVHAAWPADADTVAALAMFERNRGNLREAAAWAEKLVALRPDDSETRELLNQLRRAAAATGRSGPVR